MANIRCFAFFSLLFLLVVSMLGLASAARIYGNIFDSDFKLAQGALVRINTTPEQKIISQGNYSFDVPLGVYTLEALYKQQGILYSDSELIKVNTEGDYRIDLVLFESDEEIFINDSELNEILDIISMLPEEKKTNRIWIIAIVFIALVLALAFLFYKLKKRKKQIKKKSKAKKAKEKRQELLKSPDKFKKEVISILEKERRILQKDLRKKLNVSEAKLSLLVSELEGEGKVKRIKRGRGNILVYEE